MEAALILLAVVFGLGFWLGRLSKRTRRTESISPPGTPSRRTKDVEPVAWPQGPLNDPSSATRAMLLEHETDPWKRRRPEFRITYHDEDGVITERDIYVHSHGRRAGQMYYFSWCFLRDEERTFRGDRIMKVVNLDTRREIRDIAAYLDR